MTAQAVTRRKKGMPLRTALPFGLLIVLVAVGIGYVSYVLWPTWPKTPPLDAPAIPVTVAGVLFDVPPAAIRAAVQRHPGRQDRIDLAFDWPSLQPPKPESEPTANSSDQPLDVENAVAAAAARADQRLFVTIAALGAVLPPLERLRTIYPRYAETEAAAGPDGLAILPFRAGTPYSGEDLVYFGTDPQQFFARCTRAVRSVPGTCIHERQLDAAVMTFRFPRDWLEQWRNVASGFDRLVAQLHPQAP